MERNDPEPGLQPINREVLRQAMEAAGGHSGSLLRLMPQFGQFFGADSIVMVKLRAAVELLEAVESELASLMVEAETDIGREGRPVPAPPTLQVVE